MCFREFKTRRGAVFLLSFSHNSSKGYTETTTLAARLDALNFEREEKVMSVSRLPNCSTHGTGSVIGLH